MAWMITVAKIVYSKYGNTHDYETFISPEGPLYWYKSLREMDQKTNAEIGFTTSSIVMAREFSDAELAEHGLDHHGESIKDS